MPPSPSRWRRLEEAFARASELPDREREVFLAELAQNDEALHSEVRSLLESSRGARDHLLGLIETHAEALGEAAPGVRVGERLGAYILGPLIGEGGMGAVYRSERADGQYQHQVAIKVLQDRITSPQLVARFRDERRMLAALEHPGIVRLLDGGSTEQGVPYIVMEHVTGIPCTSYVAGMPVRLRVELFLRVCDAVQYAHQKLIVHRDIKPSNILVTRDGQPKLLDFGIAKLLDPNALASREAKTMTGMALLTPEYASPEQARSETVSVATDVYSLGAVLFELLAGKPPQAAGDSYLETLKQICELMPPLPSSLAGVLARDVAGDLDSIVLKALQKSPGGRYASVGDFAADLHRFLQGLPVIAREATLRYRAGKFMWRHRGRLAIATLVSTALLGATAVSVYQARRAEDQTRRAEFQTRILLGEQGLQELANGRARRALPYLLQLLREGDDTPALRFLIAEAVRPLARELLSVNDFTEGVSGIAWSPDGKTFAAVGHGQFARIYERSGKLLSTFDAQTTELSHLSFSRDGTRLAAVGSDSIARIWSLTGAADPLRLESIGSVTAASFSSNGGRFLTGTRDGFVHVFELGDGKQVLAIAAGARDNAVEICAFSADGKLIATGMNRGEIVLWSSTTGEKLRELTGHHQAVPQLRFSQDGNHLFSASADASARIWEVATGKEIALLGAHNWLVSALDLSADGARIVTAALDNTAKIWDAHTGNFIAALVGHTNNGILAAHFSPDAQRVVTTGGDNTFRIWDATSGAAQALLDSTPSGGSGPHALGVPVDSQFAPDGSVLLTASGAEIKLWGTGREPTIAEIPTGTGTFSAAFSPDERLVAAVGTNHLAGVWNLSTGERVATMSMRIPT